MDADDPEHAAGLYRGRHRNEPLYPTHAVPRAGGPVLPAQLVVGLDDLRRVPGPDDRVKRAARGINPLPSRVIQHDRKADLHVRPPQEAPSPELRRSNQTTATGLGRGVIVCHGYVLIADGKTRTTSG